MSSDFPKGALTLNRIRGTQKSEEILVEYSRNEYSRDHQLTTLLKSATGILESPATGTVSDHGSTRNNINNIGKKYTREQTLRKLHKITIRERRRRTSSTEQE